MTVDNIKWNKCSGCCLCENVCPKDAITMKENSEGFIHPVIDRDKCIDCGKCYTKCPVNSPEYVNCTEPECHAIISKDNIRDKAATSGIFTGFAEKIIAENGVVFGAAFNEDFSVSFKSATNLEELEKLKNSKYVQANAGMLYRNIADALSEGKKVLLGACPCQIAAAYKYLEKKDISNFYTMDIICHGVPSPKLFRKYLNDEFPNKEIEKIDFRDKTAYGWSTEVNVYFKDGTVFRRRHDEDPFYNLFLPCVGLRTSCSTCEFSKLPRQADLTIGDFWGIRSYDASLDDGKGTSVVLVNNEKGQSIIEQCSDIYEKDVIVPISEALRINKTIQAPFRRHPGRKHLFNSIDKFPISVLADKCLTHSYDIGVVGLWYGLNYGSILTYFALYQLLNDMGHDVLMVNKPRFLWSDKYTNPDTIANKFIARHCNVSNVRNDNEWHGLNDHVDTFIVGSDVVWNYEICGREAKHFFFLDFVNNTKKKIAMASSFGSGYHAPEEMRILDKYYLSKFDYVGVRELEGVEICREKFGVRADQIMDPVFIVDKQNYFDLLNNSKLTNDEPFISSYILGPDNTKINILNKISDYFNKKYKIIENPNIPGIMKQKVGIDAVNTPEVEDWLWYIKNSDFFVGDSFHGLCFALIFNIPFLIAVNSNISGMARFKTLLEMVGLQDRLFVTDKDDFSKIETIISKDINFETVNSILSCKAKHSYEWLKNAIDSPKMISDSAEELIIQDLQRKIMELESKLK